MYSSAVGESYKLLLKNCTTSFEMWETLKKEAGNQELGSILLLVRQLMDMRINARFILILDKIDCAGDDSLRIPPLIQCFLVLCSLPPEFDMLSQSISLVSKNELTMDYLRQKFAVEDSRRAAQFQGKEKNREKKEEANFVAKKKCLDCKKELMNKSHTRCSTCYQKFKKDDKKFEKKKDEKVHHVVLVGTAESSDNSISANHWILDSGATAHLTNEKSDLLSARKSSIAIVGPTGERSIASCEGDVLIPCSGDSHSNDSILLQDVVCNSSLRHKLMSVSKITKSGQTCVLFTSDHVYVVKGDVSIDGDVILEGTCDDAGL